jgi:hypothetical protein
MTLTRPRNKGKPIYFAIQIPLEGQMWVEAGRFNSHSEAFEAFERNDTNTLVFSTSEFARLVGKILIALSKLGSHDPN